MVKDKIGPVRAEVSQLRLAFEDTKESVWKAVTASNEAVSIANEAKAAVSNECAVTECPMPYRYH